MKAWYLFSLIISSLLFLSYGSGPASVQNRGYTGAPGEPSFFVCANCHSGSTYGTTTTNFTLKDQVSGLPITTYIPGITYDYELIVNNTIGLPDGWGFQITAVSDNETADEFTNVDLNSQIIAVTNGTPRNYVEHNSTSSTNTFTGEWIAPASGTGDVVFYRVGNSVDGNFSSSGDSGGTSQSTTITEDTTVPVEYSSISITQDLKKVTLQWETQSEINTDYFIIQHKQEGSFINIGKITASGFGDSYNFNHENEKPGVHYYRIVNVDLDGRKSESPTMSTKIQAPYINIYPNPVSTYLDVSYDFDDQIEAYTISVYSITGRKVLESNERRIDFSSLENGIYFIEIINKFETLYRGNIIKV